MERFLGRYEPYFYALLRIVTGFLFLMHGTQKVLGFPAKPPAQAAQQAAANTPPPSEIMQALASSSGPLELIFGLLILLGLFGGWTGFLASGMMAIAYFSAHQARGVLPIQNGGESAVLYCFIFLYIAARGSGIWSLDSMIWGRSKVNEPATTE